MREAPPGARPRLSRVPRDTSENCGVRAKRGPIDGLSFTIKS